MADLDNVDILLIEDNFFDAEMTIRSFRKSNFVNKIHWVKDGVEALEFLGGVGAYAGRNIENVPKLVLLDLKMPRLDGFDVLRALRANLRTNRIPVVAMTSSDQEVDVQEAYRLGANAYVTKPLKYEQFEAAVTEIATFWLRINTPSADAPLRAP